MDGKTIGSKKGKVILPYEQINFTSVEHIIFLFL